MSCGFCKLLSGAAHEKKRKTQQTMQTTKDGIYLDNFPPSGKFALSVVSRSTGSLDNSMKEDVTFYQEDLCLL